MDFLKKGREKFESKSFFKVISQYMTVLSRKFRYIFVFTRKWGDIVNAQQMALAVQYFLKSCKILAPFTLKFLFFYFLQCIFYSLSHQFHLNEFPFLLQPSLLIYHFGNSTDYISNLICFMTICRRTELSDSTFLLPGVPCPPLPLRGPMSTYRLISPHLNLTNHSRDWVFRQEHFTWLCSIHTHIAEPR